MGSVELASNDDDSDNETWEIDPDNKSENSESRTDNTAAASTVDYSEGVEEV